MNARRSIIPALLVGLLGFTLTLDLRAQHIASLDQASRKAELAQIVAVRQRRAADLETRLVDLRKQLEDAAARAGGPELTRLRELMSELASSSGTVEVTGPGITVRLSDASAPSANEADARIQDADVQSVVNALWDAGAEAIAINGQRVVETTAIRNAGGAILVNYRVMTSPYSVAAIGDVSQLRARFDASQIARRFRGWVDIYGLGFKVSNQDSMDVPAFTGSVRFAEARPIPR